MADTDGASESASSIGDEERVRRLFQACDANGDGYIDSQDLLAICRELSLEDSLDELMLQLGADSQGRISYEQFLQRRLALRPEIDALKTASKDNISDHSQGKLDRWEWDSGARDMSPVPKSILKNSDHFTEEEFKAKISREETSRINAPIVTINLSRADVHENLRYVIGVASYSATGHVRARKPATLASIQEGADRPGAGGEDKSCLTTYLFNPVDTCAGAQSPEKCRAPRASDAIAPMRDLEAPAPAHMHPNFLFGKVLADGSPNFLRDYELSFRDCEWAEPDHAKCCVAGRFGGDLSFGHLYTISKTGPLHGEERTYDEPYAGGEPLPRRSWLCCPGSRRRDGDHDQPPLLDATTSTATTSTCKTASTTPVVEAVTRPPGGTARGCSGNCEKLQLQLDEQAQRYEEQLTELHSVIAELTRKLHQQRAMAIAEEDEVSESCTSAHEESMTCPLEVSELEPLDNELSDLENKMPSSDSPQELPEPKLTNTASPYSEIVEPLKSEITNLKRQLHEAHSKLAQITLTRIEEAADDETITDSKNMESPESHIEADCEPTSNEERNGVKYSNIVPIHRTNVRTFASLPVTKIAERIKLKRATDSQRGINSNDLMNSDVSTAVAEHIVGDILKQCDVQTEKQCLDIELKKVNTKLEHARSQNTVLVLTLAETKAHCDRLALLCGKYESNAIALRLALGISDRTIEAYDVLLALLETELGLKEEQDDRAGRERNRSAAESVAKQLLSHLDSNQSTDVLLSPWQNHVYGSPVDDNDEPWTSEHEVRLREHMSRLKAERSNIQGTYVVLESTQIEHYPVRPSNTQEARKMDLEMAVLMQELMGLREDKAELISKLFVSEKEKSAIELKFKYAEGQLKAQSAALKNVQGQLKDTEALLVLATQNKERGYSDAEHAQGVEFELMQALAREARLKVRLQELVTTLEHVTKNAEARLLEGRDIVQDLNHTNSILADTVDRNNKKYQAKYKKMEQQMFVMVEKHTAQVQHLQQRINALETPTHSSDNSVNSVAV